MSQTTLFPDDDPDDDGLPALPYAGTSGWSGSATSRERAGHADESGITGVRQRAAMSLLHARGPDGATVAEFSRIERIHHGTASGALSNLQAKGHITRLTATRGKQEIYVLPQHIQGREEAPYRPILRNRVSGLRREVLAEVYAECALAFPDDDRLGYVTVQMSRDTWEEMRQAADPHPPSTDADKP